MKIDSYAVSMASTSVSVKSHSVTEQVVINNGANSNAPQTNENNQSAAQLDLSEEGQQQQTANNSQLSNNGVERTNRSRLPFGVNILDEQRAKMLMVEQLYGSLTGKKQSFRSFDFFSRMETQQTSGISIMDMRQTSISFQRTETYYEFQQTSFEASGVIKTADGREIKLDMNVMMSHEFYTSNSTTIDIALRAGRLCDPLVVSFDGVLPSFTQDRYEFDLILGEELENIFMPTNGSGFLALDKNGNGAIDDGTELFGAQTGDGFAELAAYDSDRNGWIDENDAVFDELKIMFLDKASGEFMYMTLKEAGIGAVYLGNADSHYEIKSDMYETQGVIRKSGFFLYENGKSGSIHHIDLTY